jgi:PleD family two-component response regulator
VILITGASGLDMKIEGFQTGASDYVAKPLNSRELLLKVDRCFNTLKDQAATLALKQRDLLQTIMNTLGHALTSPLAAIHNEVRLSQQETQNAAWAKRMNRIEVASQQIEQSLAKLQSMIKVSTKELLPGVHLLDIEEPKQPRE